MASQSSTIYAIQPVEAGDLITAALIDSLIVAIKDLDNRIHKLEAAPAAGPRTGPASPPAGLRITGARLISIGQIPTINVVGSGFAAVNSFKINNQAFTPLGRPGDDDGMAIMIDIGPTAHATIVAAIRASVFRAFTLTLRSATGQEASVSVMQEPTTATVNTTLPLDQLVERRVDSQ